MTSIAEELRQMGAPRKVVEAGEELDSSPFTNKELAQYVKDWVTRNRGNNRYGQ